MADKVKDHKSDFGCTCLHFAARGGHTNTIDLLVKRGFKVNEEDTEYRQTPLFDAVLNSKVAAARALIGTQITHFFKIFILFYFTSNGK